MSNNVQEVYRMILEADNKHAMKSFDKLKKVSEELLEIQKRLEDASSGANAIEEMNKLTKSTIEARQVYTDLKKEVEGSKNLVARIRLDPTVSKELKKELADYSRELDNTLNKSVKRMEKEIEPSRKRAIKAVEARTGREVRRGPNASVYRGESTSGEATLARTQSEKKMIESLRSETLGIGKKAIDSRYINNSNAKTWEANRDKLLSREMQGASLETIRDASTANRQLDVSEVDKDSFRGRMMETGRYSQEQYQKTLVRSEELKQEVASKRAEYNEENSKLKDWTKIRDDEDLGSEDREFAQGEIDKLKDPVKKLKEEYEEHLLSLDATQKEMKQFERVISETKKALYTLSQAAIEVKNQEDYIKSDKTPTIRQKGDRDKFMGRMSERAFSIGLAAVAAATYKIASTVSRGQQTVSGMREDSISVGMRTGDYDFRGIRQDYMTQGMDLGWSGQDMLQFSDSILSSLGYQNEAMQRAGMQNLSEFSKFSGAGKELSTMFTEGLYRSGGVETVDQAKAIQDGFLGAIRASGMEGREKEQIEALAAINDNLYRGREASYEEVRSRSLMTSLLSQQGRALQGENLADFMQTADDAIKNSDMFSLTGMLLGVGTDSRYAGPEGLYNFQKTKQEGFSVENFNTIMDNLSNMTGIYSMEHAASELTESMGLGLDVEELKNFMERFRDGIPVGAEGEALLAELQASGGAIAKDREEGYMDSPDQSHEYAEAAAARMESKLDDNKGIDVLKNIEGWLKGNAGDSTAGSLLYTGTSAFLSSVTTLLGSVVSGMVSAGVLKGTSSVFGSEATTMIGETLSKTALAPAIAGGKSLLTKGLSMATPMLEKLPGIGTALAIGNSVYQTATADDKIHEGGKQSLGLAGMWAGAKIGSAFGPVGTVIGGGIGYLGGQLAGSNVMDFFRPQKAEASGTDSDLEVLSSTATAEDQATENLKATVEGLRSDNISRESGNLRSQDTLIGRIQNLLDQAAQQNGIIGTLTGLPNTGSSLGSGRTTGSGEYWTSTNIQKHDLGVTSDAVTAQQLNDWINAKSSKDSLMRGTGETFMQAGAESGLDPRYLVAHAAWETGWGSPTSGYAKDGNFFGIGAFDNNPDNAKNYDLGIIGGAKWIAENYYNKRNATDLDSMNVNYASDPAWASGIAQVMKESEKYTQPSVTVNTTVNMNSTGNNNADGQAIAAAANRNINIAIPTAYRQEYVRT